MIKFEKITDGMTLYDVRKKTGISRMRGGNSKWDVWRVHVIQVDSEKRQVLASWNSNKAEWMHEWRITKYRAKQPE